MVVLRGVDTFHKVHLEQKPRLVMATGHVVATGFRSMVALSNVRTVREGDRLELSLVTVLKKCLSVLQPRRGVFLEVEVPPARPVSRTMAPGASSPMSPPLTIRSNEVSTSHSSDLSCVFSAEKAVGAISAAFARKMAHRRFPNSSVGETSVHFGGEKRPPRSAHSVTRFASHSF